MNRQPEQKVSVQLDFTASSEMVRAVAEGERLSFGHLFNPAFATEISQIDPLPHQRLAVYEHMLTQPRLRYLLADDAGAGKTIMSGLYIREMLSRRLLRRVLIVPPAGLVGNWRRELATLFSLPFHIVSGADAKNGNPFTGPESDRLIVSMDTLAGERVFSRLRDPEVVPYDLVIFDEAHKLSADRGNDMRVRRTDRYRLAEAIAGVPGVDLNWTLRWRAHHLLEQVAPCRVGRSATGAGVGGLSRWIILCVAREGGLHWSVRDLKNPFADCVSQTVVIADRAGQPPELRTENPRVRVNEVIQRLSASAFGWFRPSIGNWRW